MSMMDFAGALEGAPPGVGGAPPGAGGVPPPPAAEELPPEEMEAEFTSSLEALDAAEEALQAFIRLDPDQADKAVAAQCLQNVLKLKASNEDSAASGDLKSLERALQGGPAAVGGPVAGAAAGY